MKNYIRYAVFFVCALWTTFAYSDSETIIIAEGSLPYYSQTWFYNTNVKSIEKEVKSNWDEGRVITSGAYTDKGWLLTMAKGTTISLQSYCIQNDWPSSWISKNWDDGYYITTISYSGSSWLVVMSQDSRFSHQRWRRDTWSKLEKWITDNWDEGFRITEAAHNGTYWTIVMSKTNFIGAQQYFFSSGNVSEKLQELWNDGYNIQLLNHGGGQYLFVGCKYLENNGRSQNCSAYVSDVQKYVRARWDNSQKISYIGGGDNYVEYTPEPQYYSYPQYVPTGTYSNPYGGYDTPTTQHRSCAGCNGTGLCSMCKGKGWYKNQYNGQIYNCSSCNGTGKCGVCHGKGHCN